MTDTRFRVLLIVLMGALVAGVWAFPVWWPIINQDSISGERFPGLAEDLQPNFVELPAAERQLYFTLYNGDEDNDIAPQPAWALGLVQARLTREDQLAPGGDQAFTPPDGSRIIAEGSFVEVDAIRQASGDLTIYEEINTGRRILRLEDNFTSTPAPDIHIVFTRNPDPLDERGVGIDYVDVAELQGNVGGQIYTIPDSVDSFETYVVLALYSPQFDAILATATIR